MTRLENVNWKRLMLAGGIAFQIVFLLEAALFSNPNHIVVDPSVHIISFENWKKAVIVHDPLGFWDRNYVVIIAAARFVNVVFRLLFDVALVYLFIKSRRFSISRVKLVLGYLLVVLAEAAIRAYIKYNVDFYRLYMYAIFTELYALYMILLGFCLKRKRAAPDSRGSEGRIHQAERKGEADEKAEEA